MIMRYDFDYVKGYTMSDRDKYCSGRTGAAMVKLNHKTEWLVHTVWHHVVWINQSPLCIDFTIMIRGTIRKYSVCFGGECSKNDNV